MYFVGAVGCKLQVKHVRGGVVPPTRFFVPAFVQGRIATNARFSATNDEKTAPR
jgi:hypothetical protein